MTNPNFSSRQALYLTLAVAVLLIGIWSLYSYLRIAPLKDTQWQLVALNGNVLPAGPEISLVFDGDRVRGTTFCRNSFEGHYALTLDSKLIISNRAVTEIACLTANLNVLERAYLDILFSTPAIRIENERLVVYNPAGEMVLVFARR